MRSNYSLAHSPGYHPVGGGVSTPRHVYCCAPGMGNDLAVKVRYRLGSRNC